MSIFEEYESINVRVGGAGCPKLGENLNMLLARLFHIYNERIEDNYIDRFAYITRSF
jgi:hypothetical protein